MLAFATSTVCAADLHVPADYATIQSALEAAVDGDRVVVARGRYYETLRFPERDIHLIAPEGPSVTTIDGQALGTVITFSGEPGRGAIVEGFTLTNGLDPSMNQAGGVHMGYGASAVLRGNVIRQNRGYNDGHGISLVYPAAPLIEDNEIRHNRSGPGFGDGGGGGIGIRGSACPPSLPCVVEVRDNYIGNNYVTTFNAGGGIQLNGARADIIGNVIEYNQSAIDGGGISSVNGSPSRIENNLFHANRTGGVGGGVSSNVGMGDRGPFVVNNTLVANEARYGGSAIHSTGFDASSRFANNLVSAVGTGSAFFCDNVDGLAPVLRHNIVHAPDGIAYGGFCADAVGVAGNQSAAPVFMGKENFRLQRHSPGVDQGDDSESIESTDLDGHARRADGDGNGVAVIDVGAYELPSLPIFSDGFEFLP